LLGSDFRNQADADQGTSPKSDIHDLSSIKIDDGDLFDIKKVGATGGATIFGHESNERPLDIVQFSNMFFYVVEGSGKVALTAMRIGAMETLCSVEFETEDNSAKAGQKYKRTRGRIEFLPGEELKSIEIKILEDDSFDTNLDFQVNMADPIGCQLGSTMKSCRVVIIDDDVFPTNVYREVILKGDMEEINDFGISLLIAFVKFAFLRVPLVGFRTVINLVLDQLYNINYLMGVWLNVYLVDVVFAVHKEETLKELWIPHERLGTAVLVAMAILIPRALLTFIEFLKQGQLAVAGKVMLHLKVNLFRKYLYYNQASHAKVSVQELTKAMEGDINELTTRGFMVIFELAQQTVKVGVILYFLVHKRPSMAIPLLIYPLAMGIVLNMRYETTLRLKDKVRDSEKSTMTCLRESCDDINLIKEYNMRSFAVNRYEKSIRDQNPPGDAYAFYDFRTMLVMPWITNFAIAAFVIVGGQFVLQGSLSLGDFLATINIYRDAGDLFAGFYMHLKNCYTVIGPLLRLIRLLNLEGDVLASMAQAKERTQGMMQELQKDENMRKQFSLAPRSCSRFDMLHIKMMHASLANDRGGPITPSLQDISAEVEQGKMVATLGPHGSGKFSLLKLLTGLVKPKNGIVYVPTHLRCLCVPNVPELFKNGNLLENLTFGTMGNFDKARLVKICGAVGLGQHTMSMLENDLKVNKKGNDPGVPWYEALSQSELLKMHITRALVLNPEVILLHRPVDEMEADHAARILDVLRKQVDHRGLFTSPEDRASARPRTVFFTSGEDRERAESAADVADVVWHLSDKGFRSEPGGRADASAAGAAEKAYGKDGSGNKIVQSWSREVRNLEQNLAKAKHAHGAVSKEAEQHKSDLDDLKKENEDVKAKLEDVTSQAKRALRDARMYEQELSTWEGGGNSGFCTNKRSQPPSPRTLTKSLNEMIAVGEGKKEPKQNTPRDQYGRSRDSTPR
jgi:ABC-type multidrug transport system fused ATPase/permease subunit